MKYSLMSVTPLALAVLISGVDVLDRQVPNAQQGETVRSFTQLFGNNDQGTIILAGNTACNPRAQVCED